MVKTTPRVAGLDSIRFVCAFVVVLWHLFDNKSLFYTLPDLSFNLWANPLSFLYSLVSTHGEQAVTVFFVVSGFCIHFPYVNGAEFKPKQFYLRRYIRIGIPWAIILFLNLEATIGEQQLWSVDAELIFYTLYPLLMSLKTRWGWANFLGGCYVVSYTIIAFDWWQNPARLGYSTHGVWLDWLVSLPIWLSGCYLAERWPRFYQQPVKAIWLWRGLIFTASYAAAVLNFQFNVGFTWTLNLLAGVVALWLTREIAYFSTHKPWRVLEWAGQWSYSIYLCHLLLIITIFTIFRPNYNFFVVTSFYVGIVLGVSYLFYLLVEKPALNLAKILSRKPIAPVTADNPVTQTSSLNT